jgi:hypothetical protein
MKYQGPSMNCSLTKDIRQVIFHIETAVLKYKHWNDSRMYMKNFTLCLNDTYMQESTVHGATNKDNFFCFQYNFLVHRNFMCGQNDRVEHKIFWSCGQ